MSPAVILENLIQKTLGGGEPEEWVLKLSEWLQQVIFGRKYFEKYRPNSVD